MIFTIHIFEYIAMCWHTGAVFGAVNGFRMGLSETRIMAWSKPRNVQILCMVTRQGATWANTLGSMAFQWALCVMGGLSLTHIQQLSSLNSWWVWNPHTSQSSITLLHLLGQAEVKLFYTTDVCETLDGGQ
uniref:Uncharacterized protein n=1 Tax=Cyprinus carpio TaxID=7962 RepID=A0A8C1TVK6_CYPCA